MTKAEVLKCFKNKKRVKLIQPRYQDPISYGIVRVWDDPNGRDDLVFVGIWDEVERAILLTDNFHIKEVDGDGT